MGNYCTTGDGIIGALQILRVMAEQQASLSTLVAQSGYTEVPQVLRNVSVARRVALETIPALQEAIGQAEREVQGRVLLRYSGTENLLRILVEGPDKRAIVKAAKQLEQIALKVLA
ncbi:hypothetical protein COY28_05250 [Candidatus Woesearchaeota archaeon CG_4_10_14_0_2_um_filter_57_5]|nr:MAG: hypothetical protein COY28_05250 [Candidatus Woesearchaeota archaeon CG_4_10_14_0_2_um_filter_57_5]